MKKLLLAAAFVGVASTVAHAACVPSASILDTNSSTLFCTSSKDPAIEHALWHLAARKVTVLAIAATPILYVEVPASARALDRVRVDFQTQ